MFRTPQPGELILFTPDGHGAYTATDATNTERWGLLVRGTDDSRTEYVIAATDGPRWLRIETVERDGWWVRATDGIETVSLDDVIDATAGLPGPDNLSLSYHALDASYQAVRDFRWGSTQRTTPPDNLIGLAGDLLTELWEHGGPGLADRIASTRPRDERR